MKEALDLVKSQLGPDAIILSAKDNSRSYGLAGNGSVEITAAVSEEILQKKRFVESRLRDEDRDKIRKAPARVQKQFIDDMVGKYTQEKAPRRGMTSTPYIDIEDSPAATRISARPQWRETAQAEQDAEQDSEREAAIAESTDAAGQRIRTAAHRAWSAMNAQLDFLSTAGKATAAPIPAVTAPPQTAAPVPQELSSLRQEVAQLKSVLSQFQQVPQSFQASHPGAEFGLPYEMASIFEKLQQAGMSTEIIGEVLTEAQKQMPAVRFKNKPLIEGWVARHIMDSTPIVGDIQGTKIQVFVGPAGSGKTASLVKLASHYVVNGHKKVALLTTDIFKVGAAENLFANFKRAVCRRPHRCGLGLHFATAVGL
jgi:flagellar biosynthesis protein FlhF